MYGIKTITIRTSRAQNPSPALGTGNGGAPCVISKARKSTAVTNMAANTNTTPMNTH